MSAARLLRLGPNRVWRTYDGGRELDRIEGHAAPADGAWPEDWIGSTVAAVNPGDADPDAGQSRLTLDGADVALRDLIAADPAAWLGPAHAARFGATPALLVKYLDAAVRLPLQAHPTVPFAQARLGANHGKTEAYHILAVRPEVERPFIYLGFQRPPSRADLRRMILDQDRAALEACFDPIPVAPGDTFVVPGGLPHAIGGGILMVEAMEPSDFVARIEFTAGGRTIPPEARFMGRDVEFALDMIAFEPMSVEEVAARCRCAPRPLAQGEGWRREALVDGRHTDKLRLARSRLTGRHAWRPLAYTVLIAVDGTCTIAAAGERIPLNRFDRAIVPHGMPVVIEAPTGVTLLECLPPDVPDA